MDNFSTVDKLAGPNVSFKQRFHCMGVGVGVDVVGVYKYICVLHMYTEIIITSLWCSTTCHS